MVKHIAHILGLPIDNVLHVVCTPFWRFASYKPQIGQKFGTKNFN
jgi:hypothetical protein